MPCIYIKLFVSCYFWTSLLLSFLHFWNFIYWLFKSVAKPDMLLGTASDHHCFQYCQKIRAKQSQLKTWQWLDLAKTICTLLVLRFFVLGYYISCTYVTYIPYCTSKWLRKKIQKTSAITPYLFQDLQQLIV